MQYTRTVRFTIADEFMSSGPIVVLALEKENGIADLRKLMGATNPARRKKAPSARNGRPISSSMQFTARMRTIPLVTN